jgi:hypothetical protein
MLSTIVTASTNAAQLWFLIAIIIFAIALIASIFGGYAAGPEPGARRVGPGAVGGWLVIAGFLCVAIGLLFFA